MRPSLDAPWEPTGDLEMCGDKGAHLPVSPPIDDNDPNCLIGGAEMNLLAAMELWRRNSPKTIVFAYGNRSSYLRDCGGPSESEILSRIFRNGIGPEEEWNAISSTEVWTSDKVVQGPSNSFQELWNVFDLAIRSKMRRVGILTISLHMPRVRLFAKDVLQREGARFEDLSVSFFESERVLLEAAPGEYAARVAALYASQAFRRSAWMEQRGIKMFLNGTYKPVTTA